MGAKQSSDAGFANVQEAPTSTAPAAASLFQPPKPSSLVDRLKNSIGANWHVPMSELKFGRLLGKGSQGEVYLAEWRGSMIAVKKIDVRNVEEQVLDEFCSEAQIMHRLRHPSLAMFMGLCLELPHLCILTELVPRGSLFDLLQDEHVPISWNLIQRMATDVAEGMAYLHSFRPTPVLHRDLKSLNILIDENWRAKIIDFGMTRFQDINANMTQCGSPLWMAPEMVRNDPYDDRVDVYSFGVVLWELYTRRVPYVGMEVDPNMLISRIVQDNLRPPIPKHCPPAFAKLISDCWHPKPANRPSFAQILVILKEIKASGAVPGAPTKRTAASDSLTAAKTAALNKAEAESAYGKAASAALAAAANADDGNWILDAKEIVFGVACQNGLTEDFVDCRWRSKTFCARRWPLIPQLSSALTKSPFAFPDSAVNVFSRFAALRHPNVQLFIGAGFNSAQGNELTCVFEEASRGTLAYVMSLQERPFDWDISINMALDLACGLTFLHNSSPPVYLPQLSSHNNVIVTEGMKLKLSNVFEWHMERALGSAPYRRNPPSLIAPEISSNAQYVNAAAVDVFNLGTLFWEIFSCESALAAACDAAAEGGAKRPPMVKMPSDIRALIEDCWSDRRPSLESIVARLEKLAQLGPSPDVLNAENAELFHKKKMVLAFRSTDSVSIQKKWGKSRGGEGCFVVAGEDEGQDDVYCIDAETFNSTYTRVGGPESHHYRKMGSVFARRSVTATAIKTQGGTVEMSAPGDYLVQNEKGEQWAVDATTFERLYQAS